MGGPEGARTPDLIHAMDALSQLSYGPEGLGCLAIRASSRNEIRRMSTPFWLPGACPPPCMPPRLRRATATRRRAP